MNFPFPLLTEPSVDLLLQKAQHYLSPFIGSQARREARVLLAAVLNVCMDALILQTTLSITSAQQEKFRDYLKRRAEQEPLSRILGIREFWSLPFYISPATLDPRPDSETLIEAVLKHVLDRTAPLSLLEFGVGSGCLLLTLLTEYPQSWGVGVDMCLDALQVMQRNAKALNVQDRVYPVQSDWGTGLKGNFDIILSNPPYISPEEIDRLEPSVRLFDPLLALNGGDEGLDCYRILAPQLYAFCHANTQVFLEIGQGQETAVEQIMIHANFRCLGWHQDLAGIKRCGVFKVL